MKYFLLILLCAASTLTAQTTKPAKSMTDEEAMLSDAQRYFQKGYALTQRISFDESQALAYFNAALNINAHHKEAYNRRSWLHEKLGMDSLALSDINSYLRLAQSDAKAYFRRAMIQVRLHNLTAAMQDFNEAIRLSDNETDKGVFLEYRANLFDTLAAADRRLLNNLQQRTIQQEGR